MATNTYVALDKVTVGTATNTITFSSIPQTYTDLVLVSVTKSTTGNNTRLTLNNDGTSLYSNTSLGGTGSSAVSRRDSGVTYLRLDWDGYNQTTEFNVHITSVMNYTNTSVFKTVLTRSGSGPTGVDALVGLYRSTSAITRLDVIASTGNFDTGSTFSLYGIAASSVGAKATGGIISSDDQYYYHTFLSTGPFTPLQSLSADVLVVAGGGGGQGGGGGAGGLVAYTSQSLTATGYTCTVGAGGANQTNGGNSSFGALTAAVGGGGASGWGTTGQNGGSGGGGAGAAGTTINGGTGTSGQGNAGGSGVNQGGGGGGGAGAAGSNGNGTGGAGGVGSSTYSSWGVVTGYGQNVSGTYYLAGGGGGGNNSAPTPAGGYGGGGNGSNASPTAGTANTGGGGGGAYNSAGASGGSGLVIVRYAK